MGNLIYRASDFTGQSGGGGGSSALATTIAGMSSGQWLDFTMGGLNTALIQDISGNIIEYCSRGLWDEGHQVIQFVGRAHSATAGGGKKIMYDAATDAWSSVTAPDIAIPGNYHGYNHASLDLTTGDVYYRITNSRSMHKWSWGASSWTAVQGMNVLDGIQVADAISWHVGTNSGAGGLVYGCNWGFSRSNAAVSSWSVIYNATTNEMGEYHGVSAHNDEDDCVYMGGGNDSPGTTGRDKDVFRINANHTRTQVADCPVSISTAQDQGGPLLRGPRGKMIAIGLDRNIYEYSVSGNSWTDIGNLPGDINTGSYFGVGMPDLGALAIIHLTSSDANPECRLWKP